jgi:hypothetical protein
MQYKDSAFKFTRTDADMVILSNKYMEELRSLPAAIASPTVAHAHVRTIPSVLFETLHNTELPTQNLLGSYTQTGIILESDLHFRLLQSKLTPNLGSLAVPMQDELDFAMDADFPRCKGILIFFLRLDSVPH